MKLTDLHGFRVFVNPKLENNTIIISKDVYFQLTGIEIEKPDTIGKMFQALEVYKKRGDK